MRTLIIILTFITSALSYGQGRTNAHSYKSFPDLDLPNAIDDSSLPRSFTSAGSGSGGTLYLSQSGDFEFEENVDCTESISVAKGKWMLNGNILTLQASNFKKTFDIVLFGKYTFLIDRTQKQKFLKTFHLLRQKFSAEPPETKYEYIYLQLRDDYLNKRGKITSS
jgi:hypothetical protein